MRDQRYFDVILPILFQHKQLNVDTMSLQCSPMLLHRRKSDVDPICIYNLFSTSIQRRKGNYFQHLTNVILPAGKVLTVFGLTVLVRSITQFSTKWVFHVTGKTPLYLYQG